MWDASLALERSVSSGTFICSFGLQFSAEVYYEKKNIKVGNCKNLRNTFCRKPQQSVHQSSKQIAHFRVLFCTSLYGQHGLLYPYIRTVVKWYVKMLNKAFRSFWPVNTSLNSRVCFSLWKSLNETSTKCRMHEQGWDQVNSCTWLVYLKTFGGVQECEIWRNWTGVGCQETCRSSDDSIDTSSLQWTLRSYTPSSWKRTSCFHSEWRLYFTNSIWI